MERKFDWEHIKNSELVQKGKKGFFQIVFGRSVILSLMILFQILFFIWLGNHFLLSSGITAASFFFITAIINNGDNLSFQLTWAIMIGLFPGFGIPLYFMMRTDLGHRLEKREMNRAVENSLAMMLDQRELEAELTETKPHLLQLSQYMRKNGGYQVFNNTTVEYYRLGEEHIDALVEALQQAERYIFLEYFIIHKGQVWERVLKVLLEKVQQGVEVRLIYDGMLDFSALPHSFPKQLEEMGIQCRVFMPLPVILSFSYNNRDHRKIAVIDGKVAFTGGVNLADEYANLTHPFGHWKDVGVSIRGEAVYDFTFMFLQMWNALSRTDEYAPYLAQTAEPVEGAQGYALPFSDSPLDQEPVGRNLYLDILARAEKYVYITSPYLILDGEMRQALCFAAARGVDVRILLPHVPDKRYAFALAVSHYPELTRAGVNIYEYTPGFVHAKMIVSDDHCGAVGTVNLDFRSLYLHFECGVYMEDMDTLQQMRDDFLACVEESTRITKHLAEKAHPVYYAVGCILRVLAPLF